MAAERPIARMLGRDIKNHIILLIEEEEVEESKIISIDLPWRPATNTAQEKIKILGNSRSTRLKPRLNPKIKENFEKKWRQDDGGFQQQSTQRLLDRYDHMNGPNDRWTIWLKRIQVEYYSIENQKSFSNTM